MNETNPELIFGLVGAIGTDLGLVEDGLIAALATVGYLAIPVKLSELMRELNPPWSSFPERNEPNFHDEAMNAGNNLRSKLKDAAALANLAIASMRSLRKENNGGEHRGIAFILNSLKRSEEIERLRAIYGPSVFIISAYSDRESRVGRLAARLAEQQHENQSARFRGGAEDLITRDEYEEIEYGQAVRKAYPLADLFVHTNSVAKLDESLQRFVRVLFGDTWITPTKDEEGMALATLASLRSASPARQVGAAIKDDLGRVLGLGVNEVARAGGGQYWEGDEGDGRDFLYAEQDSSDKMRWNLLSDVVERLRKLDRLSEKCPPTNDLLNPESEDSKSLREAQLFDTIDFIRAVHAEASALFAAGEYARGATMYVTTFPCHECARHIVVAGIKKVVYVEPYPKSLVAELFRDSISVDSLGQSDHRIQFLPFSGIAPSVYGQMFRNTTRNRKDKSGKIIKWAPLASFPHLPVSYSMSASRVAETAQIDSFIEKLIAEGITNAEPGDTA